MVYLIVDEKANRCKIGFSMNVENRLAGLQTANHAKLIIAATIEGDRELEKELHVKFKEYQVSGEWFTNNDEIRDYFNAEPDYVMINAIKIGQLKGISASTRFCLLLISSICDYKNIIELNKNTKQELKSEYGVNISTLDKAVYELVSAGVLIRLRPGIYSINKDYITKR